MSNRIVKNKVILNQLPPAMLEMPSPAMSVLKRYLSVQAYDVKVIYWNLRLAELQSQFLWNYQPSRPNQEEVSMMLFFNYLAVKRKDADSYNYIKAILMALKPQYLGPNVELFDRHIHHYAQEFEALVDEILAEIVSPDVLCYGFSVNLSQWIGASILAEKIKQKQPDSIVVVGGIGTKDAAITFLKNFDSFDFAIWGEGEIPLTILCKELQGNDSLSAINYDHLSNTAFRQNGIVTAATQSNRKYVDLSDLSVRPDFSDYIAQKQQTKFVPTVTQYLPIETGRGCHWRRCHFCYLNTGYKFRLKAIPVAIDEIRFMIKEYNYTSFGFLDNDSIAGDYERFNLLLDGLIKIKEEFPEFTIIVAEIITKGIRASTIKKMALAGFTNLQIGYESPSNTLLKKIDKKNSFASNLLFIKIASIYKIQVNGVNIIMGLLEETSEDVLEAIHNLHTLRFYFKGGLFRHTHGMLGIMHSSPYYKQIKDSLPAWNTMPLFHYLPKNYLKVGDEDYNIIQATYSQSSPLWSRFQSIEQYYIRSNYEYELVAQEDCIIYRERLNGTIVNELAFEKLSIDWLILETANGAVISLDDTILLIRENFERKILNIEILTVWVYDKIP
jgi:hypothetical protein